ncbi:MAG: hypothetical protein AVDCRST_MAG93-4012 [uncultured Chloroflexia bacterium]|uniref:Uncharacterized protein n=1 Tax=uncultured Chloroflexia bacterium TaxID=1672391 RepID=A0A6J4K0B1_9CHLR|nr:MAG: hypothetical protein AVDCRST_MAG93-4012 [uncultured Chloroflexia bacterium]
MSATRNETVTRATWLLAATPLVLLLTHAAAYLPHEFSHSVVAWLVGIKDRPGDIDWGGSGLLNIFLLMQVNENVDYMAALDAGKYWQVALTAFAGPGVANGGLYLLSRRFIAAPSLSVRPVAAYVLFWFLFMNLANLYDYVPIRAFAADGDVAHFRYGSGVSPWLIFAVAGYLVLWAITDFYRVVLPHGLGVVGFDSRAARAAVLILATALLFGYFAIPGLEEPDPVSLFMARTSLLIIPAVVAANWQRIVVRKRSAADRRGQPA